MRGLISLQRVLAAITVIRESDMTMDEWLLLGSGLAMSYITVFMAGVYIYF
jgi:hypothetical protein